MHSVKGFLWLYGHLGKTGCSRPRGCMLALPLGSEAWLLPLKHPLHGWVYMPKLITDRQTVRAHVLRCAGKNWTPGIPPFKVIQWSSKGDMDWSATYVFLLAIHSNHMGLCRTVLDLSGDCSRKPQTIPIPYGVISHTDVGLFSLHWPTQLHAASNGPKPTQLTEQIKWHS